MTKLLGLTVCLVIAVGRSVPAVVVRDWGPHGNGHALNLQAFLDGSNDSGPQTSTEECARGMAWRTSVNYDADGDVGTWHFAEGQAPAGWTAPTPKPKPSAPAIVAPTDEPQV